LAEGVKKQAAAFMAFEMPAIGGTYSQGSNAAINMRPYRVFATYCVAGK